MQGHVLLTLSAPETWFGHVKAPGSTLNHCAQLCECGGAPVKLSAEEAAESPAPPFHSAQTTSCEVCRPVWSWLTLTRAVVDFHSCSINFPGPCSGSFPTFVSFVTVAWGLNLIHFGYVYCWSCSRLYYSKLLGLLPEASLLPSHNMEQAPRTPNILNQTTAPGLC